jgi:iron complex outermembrane receptor protein
VSKAKRRVSGKVVLFTALIGGAAALVATGAGDAVAQGAPVDSEQQAQAVASPVAFNIPAQPLAQALTQFGRQSGLQVAVDAAAVAGKSSGGVSGTMSAQSALQQLLAGTGVTYRFTSPSAVSVVAQGPGSSTALQLDSVQVQGNTVPSQAEIGNLPPPYAGGEVARGSRVGILGNRDYMDTPFSATTYTQQYIKDNQARTLVDVVQNDPTIRPTFGSSSYDDRLFIRGFQVQMSDLAFNGLYGINSVNAMPMAGIERVEVFRGPTAMLGGMARRGAVGGTINFVPKRSPDEGITQATAFYSMNANFGGQIDFGRRFGPENALGLRVNAFYQGGPTAVNYQSDSLLNLTMGFDYRSADTRLDFDVGYINRNVVGVTAGTFVAAGLQVPAAPNAAANYYQPWEFLSYNTTYGMLRFEHDIVDNFTAFVKVGGARNNGAFLTQFPTITNASGAVTGTPSKALAWQENVSVEAGLRGKLTTGPLRHEVALSGSYLNSWTGNANNALPAVASNIYAPAIRAVPNLTAAAQGAPLTSQSVLSSVGIVDAISAMGDKIQLIGGVRYQDIQVGNWSAATGRPTPGYGQNAVTPAVSLVVRPWQYLSFYGNFIQALEQGPTAGAGLTNAGAVFAPFISTQWEAGTKLDLGDFGATLSLFRISKPSSFINAATNSLVVQGEQVNSGIEFTMFGEPVKGLRPLGGFLAMSPVLTSTPNGTDNGHYAPGVPQFQANIGVDWDTPWVKGLTVGGRLVYTGQTFLDTANRQSVPAWTRVDLSAKYVFERPDGKPLALRAQLINVGNNNYWMSVPGALTQGIPRTAMLSLTADF